MVFCGFFDTVMEAEQLKAAQCFPFIKDTGIVETTKPVNQKLLDTVPQVQQVASLGLVGGFSCNLGLNQS